MAFSQLFFLNNHFDPFFCHNFSNLEHHTHKFSTLHKSQILLCISNPFYYFLLVLLYKIFKSLNSVLQNMHLHRRLIIGFGLTVLIISPHTLFQEYVQIHFQPVLFQAHILRLSTAASLVSSHNIQLLNVHLSFFFYRPLEIDFHTQDISHILLAFVKCAVRNTLLRTAVN